MLIAAQSRIAHNMTREAAGAEADQYATRPYATSTLYFVYRLRTSNIGTVWHSGDLVLVSRMQVDYKCQDVILNLAICVI